MRLAAIALLALPALITPEARSHWPQPVVLFNAGGNGWGQACVIGVGEALTAKHVVDAIPDGRLAWRAATGQESGTAEVVDRRKDRDLARVRLLGATGATSALLPIGRTKSREPEPGEHLTIVGTPGPGMRLVVHAWYLWTDPGGNYVLDAMGVAGMSGSCVVDDQGYVIAVHGGIQIDPEQPTRRNPAFAVPVVR